MASKDLMDKNKIQVWQSLRSSIGVWDIASASLSIGGPALIFSAYGIIFANAQSLDLTVTTFLSLALLFASFGFYYQISKFADASILGVKRAKEIEVSLFGDGENMLKITHLLAKSTSVNSGFYYNYYKVWGAGLVFASGILTVWRILLWLSGL